MAMRIIQKFEVLYFAICGYMYKLLVDIGIIRIKPIVQNNDIIVSLTSYGRRVSSGIVYYTITSILRQTVQPSKIILWLADNEWSDETLPKRILTLKEKGVQIKYCKDIRSYKKLIPTLKLYPESNIMTIDDDIIYNSDTIEKILKAHKEHPNAIISMCTTQPIIENGVPSKYSEWKEHSDPVSGLLPFPIGYGGTFYPKGSLHSDIMKEELFASLCPVADDIWFWFCGVLNGTDKIYVPKSHLDYSFDALYQYFHRGSALTHANRFEHANDKQFRDLFNHYKVRLNERGELVKM